MATKDIVETLDSGLRHKIGLKPADFEKHYCKLLQEYAYATRDGNWNELEKTLTHVLGELIYLRRFVEIAGYKIGEKPLRERVNEYEDLEEQRLKIKEQMLGLINPINLQ